VTLQEAAAEADRLAQDGSERELADLRSAWGEEVEAAARSADFRERAVAFRAIGQFRWRAKEELLRRGLYDESPACRGSALLSLELLSRDHPSTVNGVRSLLHTIATSDGNPAVRRLAVLSLKNGSPERNTIVLLDGLAADDEADAELRRAAAGVAASALSCGIALQARSSDRPQ
jgi:HEAT repeat protein